MIEKKMYIGGDHICTIKRRGHDLTLHDADGLSEKEIEDAFALYRECVLEELIDELPTEVTAFRMAKKDYQDGKQKDAILRIRSDQDKLSRELYEKFKVLR